MLKSLLLSVSYTHLALKKELSEGVEKYRADMDKDFLKEKLEELKAADTDIVEKDVYKRQGVC